MQSLSLYAAPACCLLKICFGVSVGVDAKSSDKTTFSPTFLLPLLFKARELVPALTEAIGDLVPGLIPRSVNKSNRSVLSLLSHLFSHVFPCFLRSRRHVLFWVEVPARDLQQQPL
jgi:hypothetical protein